eukprot:GHVU01227490.1.p1 GENE.GHVU01227490.1~~GHVU01227490.1.p1  ORF type:complete len:197 (+),score=53.57 GHVU01227490.1:24-593(+)
MSEEEAKAPAEATEDAPAASNDAPAEEAKSEEAPPAEAAADSGEAKASDGPKGFAGTWVLTKNENLDDFLKNNGVNFLIRKMAVKSSPTLKIEQDGDNFVITLSSIMMNQVQKFTVGEEAESEFHGGNKVKLNPKWEEKDKKLVVEIEALDESKGIPKQTVTRELLSDDEILMTMNNGAEAKRWFKRQQ